MFIIVAGNPCDGFSFIGPFHTEEDAADHAQGRFDCWWIANVAMPSAETF